mgnify:CR=1 FL=1
MIDTLDKKQAGILGETFLRCEAADAVTTVSPTYAAELERSTLIEILPEHPAAPMPISIVHAHGRQVPKRVRVVMSWLAALSEPLVM